jgi:hypothetical protein
LLDGRNVVGENTHLTRLGGNVDLDHILGLVDGLHRSVNGVLFARSPYPLARAASSMWSPKEFPDSSRMNYRSQLSGKHTW